MRRDLARAFTLIELLVTLALLVLLTGMIALEYGTVKERRQQAVAAEEVHRIRDAVEAARLIAPGDDRVPSELGSLAALRGQELLDPWGRPYAVDVTGPFIFSAGPDGVAGTADDITAALSPVRPRLKPSPR